MDEEHLLPDSDFSPNEKLQNGVFFGVEGWRCPKRVDNGGVDRISELPNEIISVILSFLPLKTAAATSVLSSRWSDLWKYTPNLDFDNNIVPISSTMARGDVSEYMAMVDSILQSHKALSLKQFRICFYVNKSAKWAVTKWLEFVFLRRVESLILDFKCGVDLDKVVLGESLREMNTIYGNPQTLIFFRSLKSLYLAYLEMSGEDVELFVRNCPLLVRLRITCLTLTSDIEVCGPLLKCLEIYGCKGENSIEVSAPNLTGINYGNEGKLLFENVPRLVEATFDIRTSEFIMHHFASAASCHISQLQFLGISLNAGMGPDTGIVSATAQTFWTNAFPYMPNLKKLNISSFGAYNHSLLQATRLIWASPRLEEFILLFWGFGEAPAANMQEMTNVGRSPHQHLEVFYLELADGLGLNDHVVELVTYVSNNCAGLRQIEIVGVDVPDDSPRHELLQSQVPNHVQLWIDPFA